MESLHVYFKKNSVKSQSLKKNSASTRNSKTSWCFMVKFTQLLCFSPKSSQGFPHLQRLRVKPWELLPRPAMGRESPRPAAMDGWEPIGAWKILPLPETNCLPVVNPPSFLVNTIKMVDFPWHMLVSGRVWEQPIGIENCLLSCGLFVY